MPVSIDAERFAAHVPVVIVGAGAAGLVAALTLADLGIEPLVIERDPVPQGSTALSAGLIPAAGTAAQASLGIVDTPDAFARDIQAKAKGRADPVVVEAVTNRAAEALDWLADRHGLPLSVITDFTYPGHGVHRMHGLPSRSGAELIDRLRAAAESLGIAPLAPARVVSIVADRSQTPRGVVIERPDGATERVGCEALILACNGYGGAPDLVRQHIPALAGALYFGHPGNQGDAVRWGEALGARLSQMTGHQGHGSVAHPHGILITWATMTEGGFQVNTGGDRFWNEAQGYSEAAMAVLGQPHGLAFSIFDERIAAIARQFEDFRRAEALGAVIRADEPAELAATLKLPADRLMATLASVDAAKSGQVPDPFGRAFAGVRALVPPYRAVKVTGALFHTQGGLAIDGQARVLSKNGQPIATLFAAGGAAVGVSGPEASGYLSGNGLLTAIALGRLAGEAAARVVRDTGS